MCKLSELTFIFENCDTVTIEGNKIGDFLIDDICKNISRIALNAIRENKIAKTIFIEIHKSANTEYNQLGIEDAVINVFDRILKYKDITGIEFILEDEYANTKKTYSYLTDYDSVDPNDDSSDNINQKTWISDLGHFYLLISHDKNIDDVLDKNYCNDEEMTNLKFELYD